MGGGGGGGTITASAPSDDDGFTPSPDEVRSKRYSDTVDSEPSAVVRLLQDSGYLKDYEWKCQDHDDSENGGDDAVLRLDGYMDDDWYEGATWTIYGKRAQAYIDITYDDAYPTDRPR